MTERALLNDNLDSDIAALANAWGANLEAVEIQVALDSGTPRLDTIAELRRVRALSCERERYRVYYAPRRKELRERRARQLRLPFHARRLRAKAV